MARYDNDGINDVSFKTKLLDLNDDCLEHIFKWLQVYDLCCIYDTCSKLRDIANRYYGTTYHSKYMSIRNPQYWPQNHVIKCFGQHAQKLKIDYSEFTDVLERQVRVLNSRSNGSIVHLKLLNFELCLTSVEQIKNILKNVQKLEFKYSKTMKGGFNQLILRNCPNLKDLSFKRCTGMNFNWLITQYNTIDSLTIIRSDQLFESSVQSFFNKNPNIKKIRYASTDTRPSMMWVASCLLENIKKIKEIQLSVRPEDIFSGGLIELSQHGVLKELNINFEFAWLQGVPVLNVINGVALHHTFEVLGLIHLSSLLDDELCQLVCQALCSLTYLKVLKLMFVKNLHKYIEVLSKSLISLESLFLYGGDFICQDVCTFICNSMKLENIYIVYCIEWDNLKDEIISMSTKRQGRPTGAVPLTLHLYGYNHNDGSRNTFVLTVRNSTIKMVHIPEKSKIRKFRPNNSVDITFA